MRHNATTAAFELTKPDCKALLAFAGRDACRETLFQVSFQPADGAVCATDGHVLVRAANCGRSKGDIYGVKRADLEQASKLLRRKGDALHVSRDGDTVKLDAVDADGKPLGALTVDATGVQFPPVDQVIPSRDESHAPAAVVGFNFELLSRVAIMQKAAGATVCRLRQPDDDLGPLRVDCHDKTAGTDWTAVVMPARLG
jgi:hypothetical protein